MRTPIRAVQFIAIALTALAMVPSAAHLMEFANKAKLDAPSYMIVQHIYSGWAFAGVAVIGSIAANLWLAVRSRSQRPPFLLASAAFVLMLGTLISFFVWIYPANVATAQWTDAPADLPPLRAAWESTHAVNGALAILAFIAVVAASLSWKDRGPDAP
ncbi:MAG TPA: DUF1772 domain-containing protein [Sphingomicrobium sp.]|nr:DUF1772 domain-containing protein [Sphingomicrobium sp.]